MFCNSCHQWVKELHQKLKTPQNKTGNGREHVCTWEGALSTGWISGNVDQLFDHVHFELPGFKSSLSQSLFCRHTANVIIKDKPCIEKGDRASVLRAGRFVDRDVERPTILFVSCNLNILQKKKKKTIQKKISNSPFGSAIHTNSKINCSTYNFSENTYFTEESLKYSYDSIINHKC